MSAVTSVLKQAAEATTVHRAPNDLLDLVDLPLATLTRTRGVKRSNRAFDELLRSDCGLTVVGRVLRGRSPQSERALRRAFQRARLTGCRTTATLGGATRLLVWIQPDGRGAAHIAVRRLRVAAPDAGALADAFGLTRSESRVAVALAAGMSVGEIASELGISVHTVRSHLKRTLSKTGVRRQSQLVALCVRALSPLARLAPGADHPLEQLTARPWTHSRR